MRIDDFFEFEEDWTSNLAARGSFKVDLARALNSGPLPATSDIEAAIPLANLVHENLISYGTDGSISISEEDFKFALRALKSVLDRLGIKNEIPFNGYGRFRDYWLKNGCSGSWACRRTILSQIFDPIHERLSKLDMKPSSGPTTSIRDEELTGWPTVDEELRELRRAFASATTKQNYAAVGLQSVRVIEALAGCVYDVSIHVRTGEDPIPYNKTDLRIGRYIDDALGGANNENLRGLAKKATAFAHEVKHSANPGANDAAIVADSVILLCSILKSVQLRSQNRT